VKLHPTTLQLRRLLRQIRAEVSSRYSTWVLNNISDETKAEMRRLGVHVSNATGFASGYQANVGVWWQEPYGRPRLLFPKGR
jgi:hypothetical protein